MIREIARELDAALKAQNVPVRVVFGPERADGQVMRERIVMQRDRDGGDSFGPVRSQHGNPKARFTRTCGCAVRIFAQATGQGATIAEHERRAEALLDRIVVGLDNVIRGSRKSGWTLRDGRFVTLADSEGSQTFSGAVYELRFSVERPMFDRTWPTADFPLGEARPEGAYESLGNVLEVPLPAGGEESIPFGATG